MSRLPAHLRTGRLFDYRIPIVTTIPPPAGAIDDTAARLALRTLVDSFAAGCDRRDMTLYRSLWHEGSTLHAYWPDGRRTDRRPLDDEAHLLEFLEQYLHTFHFVGNQLVELDGDRATGEVYCFAHHLYDRDGTTYDRVVAIRYHDRYRRGEHGWKFEHRDLYMLWAVELPLPDAQVMGPSSSESTGGGAS